MKLFKKADGKQVLSVTREEWEKIGTENGWIDKTASSEKKEAGSSDYKKSPKEHGFMEECMRKNKDAKDPGAYCASIVDKAKGTTEWRKGPKKD